MGPIQNITSSLITCPQTRFEQEQKSLKGDLFVNTLVSWQYNNGFWRPRIDLSNRDEHDLYKPWDSPIMTALGKLEYTKRRTGPLYCYPIKTVVVYVDGFVIYGDICSRLQLNSIYTSLSFTVSISCLFILLIYWNWNQSNDRAKSLF